MPGDLAYKIHVHALLVIMYSEQDSSKSQTWSQTEQHATDNITKCERVWQVLLRIDRTPSQKSVLEEDYH
jgi:hypothetical protein